VTDRLRTLLSSVPFAVAAVVLVILGVTGNSFDLTVAATSMLWIMLASGLNLSMGYAGLANLGVGAFYGVGAYAAGLIATKTHLGIVTALVVGTLAPAVVALVLGPLVLRTRGLQFSIATLAVGIVATDLFTNLTGVTGGSVGLSGIQRPSRLTELRQFYWLLAAAVMVVLLLCYAYYRSRTALVLRGTRDDEQLVRSLGYRTTVYRCTGFVAASALAGTAGVLYAYYVQYLNPEVFGLAGASFQAFAIVCFGGQGTVWGPVAGSLLLTALPAYVDMSPQAKVVSYGVALLVVVLITPRGIVPGLKILATRLLSRSTRGAGGPVVALAAPVLESADPVHGGAVEEAAVARTPGPVGGDSR
jgi:branched-chain amino acid transport system permease protein